MKVITMFIIVGIMHFEFKINIALRLSDCLSDCLSNSPIDLPDLPIKNITKSTIIKSISKLFL